MVKKIYSKRQTISYVKYGSTPVIYFYDNFIKTQLLMIKAQTNLIIKPDFDSKLKGISDRVNKNKTKYLLVENELKKLQKFDTAYSRGKSHFGEDGTRVAGVGSGNYIYFWKSKSLSDERIDSITASNYKITPELSF